MKKSTFFLFIISALLFFSCHSKALVENKDPNVIRPSIITMNDSTIKATVETNVDMSATGSPYKIDSLFIKDDILSIFINYSGGCKEHAFQLVSNGMYAKSMPPQLFLCLKHNANDDQCKKMILKELRFDVSDLKYKGSNTVILKLGNKKVNYISK